MTFTEASAVMNTKQDGLLGENKKSSLIREMVHLGELLMKLDTVDAHPL